MPESHIHYVRSQAILDRVVSEWRATLGTNSINHAVSIEESAGRAVVTNENGVVMRFEVREPAGGAKH